MSRPTKNPDANTSKETIMNGVKFTWINPKETEKLIGLCTVYIRGFTIFGCRYYEKEDGTCFVAMPSQKGKDGKYYSIVYLQKVDMDAVNEMADIAISSENYTYISK